MKLIITTLFLMFIFVLSGCAVNPDYVRWRPGVKGHLYKNNQPLNNVLVEYALHKKGDNCDPSYKSTRTDENGYFQMPVDKKNQLIEVMPRDECKFDIKICFDEPKHVWVAEVDGNGEIEYHTGGDLVKYPARLLFQKVEGSCDAPEWLNLKCDLGTEYDPLCNIMMPN